MASLIPERSAAGIASDQGAGDGPPAPHGREPRRRTTAAGEGRGGRSPKLLPGLRVFEIIAEGLLMASLRRRGDMDYLRHVRLPPPHLPQSYLLARPAGAAHLLS